MAARSTEESAARQMVERALLPSRNALEEVGDMVVLTGRTISSAVRPPYLYGEEFVSQFLFVLRLVWFPLLVTTVAINYGAPGCRRRTSCACSARPTGWADSSCSPRSAKSAR